MFIIKFDTKTALRRNVFFNAFKNMYLEVHLSTNWQKALPLIFYGVLNAPQRAIETVFKCF